MPTNNPLDPDTAAAIRRKARRLARRPGLDADDVAQDLTLDLLRRLEAHDPALAPRDRFARMVLAHAAADVARRAGRARAATALPDAVPDDAARRAEVARDVAEVVARLPPDLREVVEQLPGTVAGAARALGVARSTVYERLAEVRVAFERAGLRDYL